MSEKKRAVALSSSLAGKTCVEGMARVNATTSETLKRRENPYV